MRETERKYKVRTPDGQVYGPMEQGGLVQWAREGRITRETEVSSTLLSRWKKPEEIPFLAEIVAAHEAEEAAQEGPSVGERLRKTVTRTAERPESIHGLTQQRRFECTPASLQFRLLSAVIDLAVVIVIAVVVYATAALVQVTGLLGAAGTVVAGVLFFYAAVVGYFALTLAFRAQTIGQWFWGVMVVRYVEAKPVYAGRALLFTFATLLLGWLTPFSVFVLQGRALNERVSGTRVIRTRIISNE